MNEIEDVTDLDVAFGTMKGLPKFDEIPKEFISGTTKWNELFNTVFYNGAAGISISPKEGVDMQKFARWFRAHAGSFEPKHEHKEAGIAYRMSEWFEDWQMEAPHE